MEFVASKHGMRSHVGPHAGRDLADKFQELAVIHSLTKQAKNFNTSWEPSFIDISVIPAAKRSGVAVNLPQTFWENPVHRHSQCPSQYSLPPPILRNMRSDAHMTHSPSQIVDTVHCISWRNLRGPVLKRTIR